MISRKRDTKIYWKLSLSEIESKITKTIKKLKIFHPPVENVWAYLFINAVVQLLILFSAFYISLIKYFFTIRGTKT